MSQANIRRSAKNDDVLESERLPRIIIVGGTCGSGKSTIACALAEQIHYQFHDGDFYHSDTSKAKMSAGIPLSDEDRLPWLRKLASLAVSDSESAAKGVVIACSALKRQYRQILVGANKPAECRVVMLRLSEEIIAARLEARSGHFFNKSLLQSQLATLELPTIGENLDGTQRNVEEPHLLIVDGEKPVQTIVKTIIDELNKE